MIGSPNEAYKRTESRYEIRPSKLKRDRLNNNVYAFTTRAECDPRFIFKFNGFEFRDFVLLDQLPYQGWRTQSALLFTQSWKENSWIFRIVLVLCEMKLPRPGFELGSLCSFPKTITIASQAPPK